MGRIVSGTLAAMLMAVLALGLISCQEPENTVPGSSTISVQVVDAADAKTIAPEDGSDVTHYEITIHNDAENIHQKSGMLAKNTAFVVGNMPSGMWYATVDAYIDRGAGSFVKVASATSGEKRVADGEKAVLEVVLSTLDDVHSGDVFIDLVMPTLLAENGAAFNWHCIIEGLGGRAAYRYESPARQASTGEGGVARLSLDADAVGLLQGSYRIEVAVYDGASETASSVVRRGVDVMRLVNGLEAFGSIDLSSYDTDQSFEVSITDAIGDELHPQIVDGKDVYQLEAVDGGASLTVTLAEPVSGDLVIEWYVDGIIDGDVDDSKAAEGAYGLSFASGRYMVTAIVRDEGTQMSVGSLSFAVEVEDIRFSNPEMDGPTGMDVKNARLFYSNANLPSLEEPVDPYYMVMDVPLLHVESGSGIEPVIDPDTKTIRLWTAGYRYFDKATGEPVDLGTITKIPDLDGSMLTVDAVDLMMQIASNTSDVPSEIAPFLESIWNSGFLMTTPLTVLAVVDGNVYQDRDPLFGSNRVLAEIFDYDVETIPVWMEIDPTSNPLGLKILNTGTASHRLEEPSKIGFMGMSLVQGATELITDPYIDEEGHSYPFRLEDDTIATDFSALNDVLASLQSQGIDVELESELYLMQGEDLVNMLDMDHDELQQYRWTAPVAYEGGDIEVAVLLTIDGEVATKAVWKADMPDSQTTGIQVGDTVTVDGIEVLVLAAKDDAGSWNSTAGAEGVEYIGVDKNHDLSFYIVGDDYVDSNDYNDSPGTFGYEWGGYGTETGIQDTAVGTGLANTNALIGMNLQPRTEGWWVVWDRVNEFRQSHSDSWFVPSKDELFLVYQQKSNLSNLSLNTNYYYWSSSEDTPGNAPYNAWSWHTNSGSMCGDYKHSPNTRVRLCVQFTQSDID